ncbi:disulfide bond formation protein B [Bordetella sp. BOR01]|uniref:disulfide bond formation protein B n=1 Tax=Bordetella sp. BOR01 TaxID=2854779 RepID=UPI001C493743|nr:disulfide bond formation protein B [Bordetella sp. BOR01]MBV7486299.1 disulfide bond formation protein B [Bordetella sp. BOR01]
MHSSRQRLLLLIAVLCFAAVGLALVSQHFYDLPPCAWCVLQRLIYLAIGVVALVGAFAGAIARVCSALCVLLGVGGITAAWYQYDVAAQMFSCDQTFADRFMSGSGLDGGMPWLFGIYATCMDATVEVMGVEYVLWSLALFAVLVILSLRALLLRR